MRAIITGATGFVGINLKNHLLAEGHEVECLNRFDFISDLGEIKANVLYHCAAELKKERYMFESNIELTYELLQEFQTGLADKFVYIGSSSEYGRKAHSIGEEECYSPETLYAATKGCGSLLCQAFSKMTDKPIIIARPFSLYGPYQPSSKFIPTLYDCYKNKKKAVLDTRAVHDWIYIDEFIRGLEMLADYESSDIFNFGSGRQVTNESVFEAFCDVLDYKVDFDIVEHLRPYDSCTWVCNTVKTEKVLGFSCIYDLHMGLEKYLKFMEEGQNGRA